MGQHRQESMKLRRAVIAVLGAAVIAVLGILGLISATSTTSASAQIVNPVTGLTVTPRYTQMDVTWDAETGAGQYWVRADIGSRQVEWVTACGDNSNFVTFHNMDQGTTYTVTVWAGPAGPGTHASTTATTKGVKPATSGMPTVTTTNTCPTPTPSPTPTTPTPTPTQTTPTPTPTPTPTDTGGLNFAADPSAHGYPDATNTGASASLPTIPNSGPGWHNAGGYIEVDTPGTTLSGYNIPFNVDVTANNVTIKGNYIRVDGEGFGVSLRHTSNVTVENNTIRGASTSTGRLLVGIKDIYGDSTGTQVLGNNIFYVSTGVQMDEGLIQGNYIHDMGMVSGDHINGTTSNAGGPMLTIKHNTIFNQFDQTDAVSLFEDFGAQSNRLITDNILAGGGYTIYGGQNSGGATATNITITNNRISPMFYPNGGFFGWLAATNSGMTISGNINDATGALLN